MCPTVSGPSVRLLCWSKWKLTKAFMDGARPTCRMIANLPSQPSSTHWQDIWKALTHCKLPNFAITPCTALPLCKRGCIFHAPLPGSKLRCGIYRVRCKRSPSINSWAAPAGKRFRSMPTATPTKAFPLKMLSTMQEASMRRDLIGSRSILFGTTPALMRD